MCIPIRYRTELLAAAASQGERLRRWVDRHLKKMVDLPPESGFNQRPPILHHRFLYDGCSRDWREGSLVWRKRVVSLAISSDFGRGAQIHPSWIGKSGRFPIYLVYTQHTRYDIGTFIAAAKWRLHWGIGLIASAAVSRPPAARSCWRRCRCCSAHLLIGALNYDIASVPKRYLHTPLPQDYFFPTIIICSTP